MKKGIRFADAIIEWGPLIAHVSQSETVQFASGKREAPKPAELLNAGEFRTLRSATRALPSTCELLKKLDQNFYDGRCLFTGRIRIPAGFLRPAGILFRYFLLLSACFSAS